MSVQEVVLTGHAPPSPSSESAYVALEGHLEDAASMWHLLVRRAIDIFTGRTDEEGEGKGEGEGMGEGEGRDGGKDGKGGGEGGEGAEAAPLRPADTCPPLTHLDVALLALG